MFEYFQGLPTTKNINKFGEIIRKIREDKETVGNLQAQQHIGQIPDDLKRVNILFGFLTGMVGEGGGLENLRERIVAVMENPDTAEDETRGMVLAEFALVFLKQYNGRDEWPTTGKLRQQIEFLCSIILAEIEEVVGYVLFGKPNDDVHLGYGSTLAMAHLDAASGRTVKEKFRTYAEADRAFMKDASPLQLASLGKYRDDDGVVRNKINHREHTVTDAEHGACKFGMAISSVHSSRSRSLVPLCATGYCWPLPNTFGEWVGYRNILEVFESILVATQSLIDNNQFSIATQFMLLSEEEFYQMACASGA